MVKKLLKYEFIYYIRTFALFLPIVLLFGIVARISRFFDEDNVLGQIAINSSFVILGAATVALLSLSTIIAVVRFYKNMYSAEGYLTFTLPVTNGEHIFVKLSVAFICQAVCLFTLIVSWIIALSGEPINDLVQLFDKLISETLVFVSKAHMIGYTIELLVWVCVATLSAILLLYACITVGQMAKKNRVLAAFGAYFVYYVATQIVSTLVTVACMAVINLALFKRIIDWLESNYTMIIHFYICGSILLYAVLAVAFGIVTEKIMTRKLNLE